MKDLNALYTELIRQSRPSYWGNWSLDKEVQPGAIGMVLPDSGEFRGTGKTIAGVDTIGVKSNNKWCMKSENIKKHELNLSGDANAANNKAELEVRWHFDNENSICSEFSVACESYLENYLSAIMDQWEDLYEEAEKANMAGDNMDISQGFGVITHVIYAKSGLNIASRSKNSEFSITGSLQGIKSLLGEASGEAGFTTVSRSENVESHIWPDDGVCKNPQLVPIAFAFASFEGKRIIPNWTDTIRDLCICMKNKGTYIVDAICTYEDDSNKEHRKDIRISGGMNKNISLPLDAKNIRLELDYQATGQDRIINWRSPLGEWEKGKRTIIIKGIWPGSTSYEEK